VYRMFLLLLLSPVLLLVRAEAPKSGKAPTLL
jgi:hypothetical protein